jgi:hypothetical protein
MYITRIFCKELKLIKYKHVLLVLDKVTRVISYRTKEGKGDKDLSIVILVSTTTNTSSCHILV